jgi:hypothetical protein
MSDDFDAKKHTAAYANEVVPPGVRRAVAA